MNADALEIVAAPADEAALLRPTDFARLLAVSLRTLWRLRSAGRLPSPIRLGGSIRWSRTEVEAWIAAGCPASPARNSRPGN